LTAAAICGAGKVRIRTGIGKLVVGFPKGLRKQT